MSPPLNGPFYMLSAETNMPTFPAGMCVCYEIDLCGLDQWWKAHFLYEYISEKVDEKKNYSMIYTVYILFSLFT